MARRQEHRLCLLDWREKLAKRNRAQMRQRCAGLFRGIERQRRLVPRIAVAIGELRVTLQQMAAVDQQDLAKIGRRRRALDGAAKALLHQHRQVAGMVEMGMGEDDGADRTRIDR